MLRLHPKKIDLSLGRILKLLELLGSPHENLPPVVHVAGTNGKGSSIAFMRAMLEVAGYRVHVYSSPHLVRFNERIRLAGELIAESDLSNLLEDCERVNKGEAITYFEITTAAAFKAFASIPADIVLLECGLGGRYDATTVVPQPILTAITPVSMDHMQFLGDTLAEIASEKAAIQKPGVISVIGDQSPTPLQVIENEAMTRGALLHRMGVEWHVRRDSEQMIFDESRRFPLPALPGPHQVTNAGLAIACIDNLDDFHVSDNAIEQGPVQSHCPRHENHPDYRYKRSPIQHWLPDVVPAMPVKESAAIHQKSSAQSLAAHAIQHPYDGAVHPASSLHFQSLAAAWGIDRQ